MWPAYMKFDIEFYVDMFAEHMNTFKIVLKPNYETMFMKA